MAQLIHTCLANCIWRGGSGYVQTRKIIVPSLGRRVNRGPLRWSVPQALDRPEVVSLLEIGKSVPYKSGLSGRWVISTYQDFLILG
jgi:hypothetical protein